MRNFVTTNIRIPEEDYIRLKEEAAKKRQSFSAIIREKITIDDPSQLQEDTSGFMKDLEGLAKKNAKKLKTWDSLQALRETRDEN